jgi:glycerophosphoryl diester phosphodiesterase
MTWFDRPTPLILGHRGASAYAPENTLAAFRLAADQGADGVELDVQLSADGWPVIMHDRRVDRTTNGSGAVRELKLSELKALEMKAGQQIPTLDELFETTGTQLLYNVEIKEHGWRGNGSVAAVADCVRRFGFEDRVLVSSFNPFTIRRAQRVMANETPLAMIRAPGIFRYTFLLASGAADHPHFSLVNRKYMDWAINRGYRVHVWTVNEPDEARRLAGLGVHAIITNKPDLIRSCL